MSQLPLSLSEARARRDTGMRRAADHAEVEAPGWTDLAFDALVSYASAHPEFTSEGFRNGSGIKAPTTPKALGAVFRRAAREGVIRKAGYAISRERNCSPCPIWQSLIYRSAA